MPPIDGESASIDRLIRLNKCMTHDLRHWIALVEKEIGFIKSRFSDTGTSVFNIRSRAELDALLKKVGGSLRGSLDGSNLDVWDGRLATHRNYEDTINPEGARIHISGGNGGYSIDYNANDITPSQIKRSSIIRRIFTPDEIRAMTFGANEM